MLTRSASRWRTRYDPHECQQLRVDIRAAALPLQLLSNDILALGLLTWVKAYPGKYRWHRSQGKQQG